MLHISNDNLSFNLSVVTVEEGQDPPLQRIEITLPAKLKFEIPADKNIPRFE